MEQGIGWVPKFGGKVPLLGVSHGAAGFAWALLDLAALTGEERFRKAGCAAIAYERSMFSAEARNWPDLRQLEVSCQPLDRKPDFHLAWCHGAPGIGLARLRSLPYLDNASIRHEIDVALQTTVDQGFGHNHCLCHGDLGNLELLSQASRTLGDRHWNTEVNRFSGIILDSIHQHGWLCGVPFGVESPGLMSGLAGIGYGLLRLAEPDRVPSVLLMAPPVGRVVHAERAI
jgi:lantibiotic modifying enzyme